MPLCMLWPYEDLVHTSNRLHIMVKIKWITFPPTETMFHNAHCGGVDPQRQAFPSDVISWRSGEGFFHVVMLEDVDSWQIHPIVCIVCMNGRFAFTFSLLISLTPRCFVHSPAGATRP